MNIGPVEDRLAIRELIESFAAGAMRLDAELWGSTWAEDGAWKLMSMPAPVRGRENIKRAFSDVMAYVDFMSMMSFPHGLVVDSDTARGKAYCREMIFTKAGEQKYVVGCYDDNYVKQEGRWYFASRFYEVMGVNT